MCDPHNTAQKTEIEFKCDTSEWHCLVRKLSLILNFWQADSALFTMSFFPDDAERTHTTQVSVSHFHIGCNVLIHTFNYN